MIILRATSNYVFNFIKWPPQKNKGGEDGGSYSGCHEYDVGRNKEGKLLDHMS